VTAKPTKFSTKLPNRTAMKGLLKSNMSINDYAKITPSKGTELEMSPLLQQLRTEQARRR
jgi:hypothetical protein